LDGGIHLPEHDDLAIFYVHFSCCDLYSLQHLHLWAFGVEGPPNHELGLRW
jgi:hypothetical protein